MIRPVVVHHSGSLGCVQTYNNPCGRTLSQSVRCEESSIPGYGPLQRISGNTFIACSSPIMICYYICRISYSDQTSTADQTSTTLYTLLFHLQHTYFL